MLNVFNVFQLEFFLTLSLQISYPACNSGQLVKEKNGKSELTDNLLPPNFFIDKITAANKGRIGGLNYIKGRPSNDLSMCSF